MIREVNDITEVYKAYLSDVYLLLSIDASKVIDTITSKPSYTAFGYYIDGNLVGFIDGYALNDEVFQLGIAYRLEGGSSLKMVKLTDYMKQYVISQGYKVWYSLVTKDTQSIIKKLGFKEIKWV